MGEKLTIDLDNLREAERAKLMEIIESATKRKTEPWKPECENRYYFVKSDATAGYLIWYDWDSDKKRYELGNCFETKEEAEFVAERIKVIAELRRFAKTHNSPEFDRNISGCEKWYLLYAQSTDKIEISYGKYILSSEAIFENENIARAAIKEIGEERLKKYYFCIPDDK